MNYWIERTPDELKQVLKRVDVLLINDSEARQLAGEANLVKAARAVQAMGPKTLVIKRGEHGVLMTRRGRRVLCRAGDAARGRCSIRPAPATPSRADFWAIWRRATPSMTRRSPAPSSTAARWRHSRSKISASTVCCG